MPLSIYGLLLALLGAPQGAPAANQAVGGALLPLPESLRGAATVVRLDALFRPEVVRAGTNGMVCISGPKVDAEVRAGALEERVVPESQQRQVPYVMSSGNYWAHVMIRHPAPR